MPTTTVTIPISVIAGRDQNVDNKTLKELAGDLEPKLTGLIKKNVKADVSIVQNGANAKVSIQYDDGLDERGVAECVKQCLK
jgi:hypothetical protein